MAGKSRWIPIALALLGAGVWTIALAKKAEQPTAPLEQLWVEPTDLQSRDLFYGVGGTKLAPKPAERFNMKDLDKTGHSGGYDVVDSSGRKWDVKIGDEAQSEVAVSRLVWALGYHQPVLYYVSDWRLDGGPKERPEPGRFRLESDHKIEGQWSWVKNPFRGTPELRRLLVLNVLVNNWDYRGNQNRIFKMKDDDAAPGTRYVVQDLGASLGKTWWPLGGRNDLEGFETQRFILGVKNGRVKFDYHSRHQELWEDATPEDVVWVCRMLSRLSDLQLDDAFRTAQYSEDERRRFVRKLREKIQEGLALEAKSASSSEGHKE